jgi:hypothetical protein
MNIRFLLYFVVPLSLGVIITVVGAILLFIDSRKKQKVGRIDIEGWATTGGKVTAVRLDERQLNNYYEPIIEYVYTVKDAEYHGNKVFPGDSRSPQKDVAQEILDKHPLNSYVPVHYNPQNPSESALEEQPHPMNFIALTGWILTGFGFCACCFTALMTLVIFGASQ